ncbi:MAG: FAD-dependent oxidoreductase [Acetobacteraceae bacterium]|nr:FAD-dependent oxidoreductase [Acetobacteraceae bacterium]
MRYTHDLIVIGAGAAGLTAAGGCARLGLRVALIERDRMGGECLNTGCVPSKALIAAARRAHLMRSAPAVGVAAVEPEIDFARVRAHVQAAIAAIAPHDSEERFQGWGVEVIRGHARFLDARSVAVDGRLLAAPRIVVAVGSRPAIPDIEGLARTPYLTNETVFDLDVLPRHLVVLGGGTVGLEMAQAFRRLGAAVTVVEAERPLSRDDPDAAAVVLEHLAAEGVAIRSGTRASRVATMPDGVRVDVEQGEAVTGSHLLVAVGRRAALDGLGLDTAGVETTAGGIQVDARRRTSNYRIYAIGDCRAGPRFTHAAGYEGALIVREVALGLRAAADYRALPWVTYTDPELAHVGLTEAAARERHGRVEIHRLPFSDNDRAVAESAVAGFAKVVKARGRVVGATLVGAGAGELVMPWSLAIAGKASPRAISGAIVPYPTRSEVSKAVAFAGYEALVFGRQARLWARSLARMRR